MPLLQALVLPHAPILVKEVGKGEEKQAGITISSYEKVMKEAGKLPFDTVILISPHMDCYSDCFMIEGNKMGVASFVNFRAPEVKFRENYDQELTKEIVSQAREMKIPVYLDSYSSPDFTQDHGSMVPLYFLEKERKDFKLVRISLSGFSFATHYLLGMAIRKVIDKTGRKVLLLASGDMSHCQKEDGPYGYKKVGVEYDKKLVDILKGADFLSLLSYPTEEEREAECCGHPSFSMMAGVLDRTAVETKFYSHEAPFGIGYGILSYTPKEVDESRNFLDQFLDQEKKRLSLGKKDPYVELARKSIQDSFEGKVEKNLISLLPEDGKERRGCFVSLHLFSNLRGCVGTMLPTKSSLAEEIYTNAKYAAFQDERFDPLKKEEFPYLEISVDILSPLEEISSLKSLDPRRYGVYVRTGDGRSGVLLPDLPGVDTIEE